MIVAFVSHYDRCVFTKNTLLTMAGYAHASTSTVVGDEVCDIRPTDKPRKRSRKIYRPEMIKRAKVSGLAHTTHNRRREVLAREMGPDCR